ncbi:MAG: hypothetical protein ABI165_08160, partial [Bryobacteraceae bacterium]
MTPIRRGSSALLLLAALLPAASYKYAVTPEVQSALVRISAGDMRGQLSFLASDLLEGRNTPSPGLDIAAEYIASEFRRIGLKPVGDDGYFQTAAMHQIQSNFDGFSLSVTVDGKTIAASPDDVAVRGGGALDLTDAPVVKLEAGDLATVAPAAVEEKVVLIDLRRRRRRALETLT